MNTSQDTKQELEKYQDAVWDYMLEHCDVTENGSFFVKFHTGSRVEFEKHIKGRWKYGYHRHDDRMDFTHKQKEIDATARKAAHQSRKEVKKRKHQILKQEKMKAAHEALRISKMHPFTRFIHRVRMQLVAQKWYNMLKHYVNKIAKKENSKD